jgi:hypothetical protein
VAGRRKAPPDRWSSLWLDNQAARATHSLVYRLLIPEKRSPLSIDVGGLQIAELRIVGVSGTPGIGFHRLQFSLEISLPGTPGRAFELGSLTAFAYAGISQSGPKPLGIAHPETSWFKSTTDHPRREMLGMYIDLAGEQLEALERLRGGGSLFFQFQFRMLVRSSERGVELGFEYVWFEASLSEWSKVLKQLGYLELLLVAVELPFALPQALRTAIDQLRSAHQDLIAGRYDSTVGRCRMAMDAVEAVVEYESATANIREAFSSRSEIREAMTKRERADLVRMAIRHYTHLAHHVDSGVPESFGRQDALFILTAAAGSVWDAAAQLRNRA